MERPVIAVTSYDERARWDSWDQRAVLVPTTYIDQLTSAGASAMILPPGDAQIDVLARVDGLVLIGGPDLDAGLYGQPRHASADEPHVARDAAELALYRRARELDLPVLGICRGLQVMAVAHGGSLIQHLPQLGSATKHAEAPGSYACHRATLVPDSLIAKVVGVIDVDVQSSHHQCVDEPGSLTVTGWADDGTIEVCEDPTGRFVLGVQGHPEVDVNSALFRALVDAAKTSERR